MTQDFVWEEPQTPEEIYEDLIDLGFTSFYVLVSGGRDSFSVAHKTKEYLDENYPGYFKGAVFTNTGIASQITRKFTIDYCKELGIPLNMTWARKPYYDIVMEKGFPGAGSHKIIMGYLKFHAWYYFWRYVTKELGQKACFISGVRKKESMMRDKRKFYSKKPIDVNAMMTFGKPFLYKNGAQLVEYHIKNGLKKTPAYDLFDKSGECWCGCFYNNWELKMIEKHDPFLFSTIKWLESQLQKHGTKEAKKFPYWGRSVGADYSELQTTLDFNFNEDYCGESCEIQQ
jgi:3'-phosphoadenosine 5'-phosphosulfate sulfotransferase (PAPS reductase)/FAD synthetase